MSEYNICLILAVNPGQKCIVVPMIREECHCGGEHFKARGTLQNNGKRIAINVNDYNAFTSLEENRKIMDRLNG